MDTNERWIKWEPIKELTHPYIVDEIQDNLDGFSIVLTEFDNEKKKIKIFFKDSVNAYRCTEESYRLNIKNYFEQPDGSNLYGRWTFFKAKNSSYLSWLEKESCGFFDQKRFVHYVIVGENQVIDIASIEDPIVEVVSF